MSRETCAGAPTRTEPQYIATSVGLLNTSNVPEVSSLTDLVDFLKNPDPSPALRPWPRHTRAITIAVDTLAPHANLGDLVLFDENFVVAEIQPEQLVMLRFRRDTEYQILTWREVEPKLDEVATIVATVVLILHKDHFSIANERASERPMVADPQIDIPVEIDGGF